MIFECTCFADVFASLVKRSMAFGISATEGSNFISVLAFFLESSGF